MNVGIPDNLPFCEVCDSDLWQVITSNQQCPKCGASQRGFTLQDLEPTTATLNGPPLLQTPAETEHFFEIDDQGKCGRCHIGIIKQHDRACGHCRLIYDLKGRAYV